MLLAGVLTISLVIDLESKYSKICTMKILSLFLGGQSKALSQIMVVCEELGLGTGVQSQFDDTKD